LSSALVGGLAHSEALITSLDAAHCLVSVVCCVGLFLFLLIHLEIYSDCQTPWHELIDASVMPAIQQRQKLAHPPSCAEAVYALMLQCWRIDAASRPTGKELLEKLSEEVNEEDRNAFKSLAWPSMQSFKAQVSLHRGTNDYASSDSENAVDLASPKAQAAFSSLLAPHASVTLGELLGSGAFGEVRIGLWKSTSGGLSQRVAVKCLKEGSIAEEDDKFLQEAKTLSVLRHPNIVRLVGACVDRDPKLMLLEFMALGDFQHYLRSHESTLSSGQLLGSACQIADAMTYLERLRVIHRDLAARFDLTTRCLIRTSRLSIFCLLFAPPLPSKNM
jgi:hypothetical protein